MNSFLQIGVNVMLSLAQETVPVPNSNYFIIKLNDGNFLHELPILLAKLVTNFDFISLDISL